MRVGSQEAADASRLLADDTDDVFAHLSAKASSTVERIWYI